ncbi:SanA/YdcF family protein [Halomonas urumqiensis]|uniref:SanA-like protein n=1 Tax=Halomonas urumqiensis TaxID=1684789 RepID=A0A2N7UKW8_9GAMM|nr:ElyC/SanA/YdcF family protein [Halomonas urumqiensis]PMR81058.1 sanA-like protein [Halomonas urumqiensis]PTB01085.1 sanA-like protein [Halomonas urumqiensis]GHE22810.1 vancomycin high temperature exclusion protein [Halomonas urumqiensis]
MQVLVWKAFKVLLMSLGALALLATLLFVGINVWVVGKAQSRIETTLPLCRAERVGIVFGTSHWTRSGVRNPHFDARMSASARLIRLGRVDHLLLSGDNRTRYYNEPVTMWRDLRSREVRDADMTLDYAGFSTFDTLARAREVFDVHRALLVTQSWHLPRALFIADALGVEATGCAVPARPVSGLWKLVAREWVARVATIGDLYLWGRAPYFLGPLEPLEIAPREWDADQNAHAAEQARASTALVESAGNTERVERDTP